jgi:transcriptional regulator with XRE-family HTH domain
VTEAQPGGGATVRRMLVGAQLRRLRTQAGLTREQAAEAIRASAWKLHRLENGQVSFKERDIADLLALYGVTDADQVTTLIDLAREANAPSWWSRYSDLLPPWVRAYIDLESAASLIRTYQDQLVPGLLQTEDYLRAVIAGAHLGDAAEDAERRVALRMGRQALLERTDGFVLWAVVEEAALRRPVGGPKVLRAQLERLIEATALPTVTLQVLPLSVSAHAAMVGAFSILRFPEPDLPDVVYVEHLTSALYLDKRSDVDAYTAVMSRLEVVSAPPHQTVAFLSRILKEVDGA